MKITNFHYVDTTFKQPAEFVEYPKWIHMSGYPSEIAPDAEAEARLLSRHPKSGDVVVALEPAKADAVVQPMHQPDPVDAERDALIRAAQTKNIKIDRRWGLQRLRETLNAFRES